MIAEMTPKRRLQKHRKRPPSGAGGYECTGCEYQSDDRGKCPKCGGQQWKPSRAAGLTMDSIRTIRMIDRTERLSERQSIASRKQSRLRLRLRRPSLHPNGQYYAVRMIEGKDQYFYFGTDRDADYEQWKRWKESRNESIPQAMERGEAC